MLLKNSLTEIVTVVTERGVHSGVESSECGADVRTSLR